jgi:hypothetical protein
MCMSCSKMFCSEMSECNACAWPKDCFAFERLHENVCVTMSTLS